LKYFACRPAGGAVTDALRPDGVTNVPGVQISIAIFSNNGGLYLCAAGNMGS
jgi:hypothetical protein